MIANYHTHTARCGHASGRDEAYVQAALASGIRTLGFSDHTPYPFPEVAHPGVRMTLAQLPEYAQAVLDLRRDYRDRLDIRLGLEAEYYPDYFADLLPRLRDAGIEYLILGQHWCGNELGEIHINRPTEDPQRLERYCRQAMDAMQTGVFTYFAHPDLPQFLGDGAHYDRLMTRLCREAKSCGMPLEINLLGLSTDRSYPRRRFWELAAAEGCTVVLGRDAHAPEQFLDAATEEKARALAQALGIELLEDFPLRKL